MKSTSAGPSAGEGSLSSIQELFATTVGRALTEVKNAEAAEGPWTIQTALYPDLDSSQQISASASVSFRLEGDLAGGMILCLPQEGAVQLLGQIQEGDPETVEHKWTEFLRSSQRALLTGLEPVFGTVTLHPGRDLAAAGKTPLAELRMAQDAAARAAVVSIFLDTTLATSLERLATATNALSENEDVHRPAEDRERLHRVIDVPLAVTLRFGQRQMTLRELLALSTGSLVELDRQVEEPVDLMLGERIVARGEVVIVDGNYGMRVLEVIEAAGTHAVPLNA